MTWFDDAVDFFDRMRQTPWGQATIQSFIGFIDPDPAWFALDVGCGPGNLAMALAHRVARVAGIDESAKMIERADEHCREAGVGNCEFRVGVAEAIPYPDDTFDLATTSAAFYLVFDQEESAAELVRVVKPGGLIAMHEPTPLMTPKRMRRFVEGRNREGEETPDLTGWAQAAVASPPLDEDRVRDLFEPEGARLEKSRRLLDGMVLEAKVRAG
jgi:ubiquinone/menaquinone biosynthesis C-methylase UbiE